MTFDAVFEESRSRVVHTAFLIVGSLAVAEEIAQEAFIRLLAHFDDVTNPGGFLRTTARATDLIASTSAARPTP